MRTIKFRAKSISQNEWIYGFVCFASKAFGMPLDSLSIQEFNEDGGKAVAYRHIDEQTIGQFTGVYDDTDEEVPIWEGDILEIIKINDDATSQKINAVVKWLDIFGGFVVADINRKGSITLLSQVISDLLVYKIGNIHDNPELLKGGTE